jgi:hypothetical protein
MELEFQNVEFQTRNRVLLERGESGGLIVYDLENLS